MIAEFHTLGDLKPESSGGHDCPEVCAPHPGGKGTECPIGTGVTVRADDCVSRKDEALLRQKGMFDPHLSNLEEVSEAVSLGEIPEDLTLLSGEDVLRRSEVVRNENDAVPMKDPLGSDLFEGFDGERRGNIVPEGQIDPGIDEVTRKDGFLPSVSGQDFP
jgi:hypothetical protein